MFVWFLLCPVSTHCIHTRVNQVQCSGQQLQEWGGRRVGLLATRWHNFLHPLYYNAIYKLSKNQYYSLHHINVARNMWPKYPSCFPWYRWCFDFLTSLMDLFDVDPHLKTVVFSPSFNVTTSFKAPIVPHFTAHCHKILTNIFLTHKLRRLRTK